MSATLRWPSGRAVTITVLAAALLALTTGCGSSDQSAKPGAAATATAPSGATNESARTGEQVIRQFAEQFLGGHQGIEDDSHETGDLSASGEANESWRDRFNAQGINYWKGDGLRDHIASAILEAERQLGLSTDGLRDVKWYAGEFSDSATATDVLRTLQESGDGEDLAPGVLEIRCGASCADSGLVGQRFVWAAGPAVFVASFEWDDGVGYPSATVSAATAMKLVALSAD